MTGAKMVAMPKGCFSDNNRTFHALENDMWSVWDEERTVNSGKDGKSVFAKFVKNCDIALRPFDKCIMIDDKDKLLAVGSCLLNRAEVLSLNVGMDAKTREHI